MYLALSITKIQDNGVHNVLKRSGVTKDVKDGFSFVLVTRKVLMKTFDVLRKKKIVSKYCSGQRGRRKSVGNGKVHLLV